MKKAILLAAAVLISTFTSAAATGITLDYTLNSDTAQITVNGNAAADKVSIQVFREDENGNYKTDYIDEAICGETGDFSLSYPLYKPSAGTLYIIKAGTSAENQTEKRFKYYSSTDIDSRFNELKNTSDKEEFKALLLDSAYMFGFNEAEYNALPDERKERVIDGIIKIKDELTKENIKEKFNALITEQTAAEEISAGDTEDKIDELLKKYSDALKIDMTGDYEDVKAELCKKIIEHSAFIGYSEISDFYTENLILLTVNKIEPLMRDEMLEKLEYYKDIIGIADKFFGKAKNTYVIKMMGKTYASLKDIKQAAESAMSASSSGGSGGGSSSGSSGGGKTTTSGSFTPVVTPVQPDTKPAAKSGFTDLESVTWAEEYINLLYADGIINGRDETTFAPNDNVTRAEFAKMLVLAFGLKDNGGEIAFADVLPQEWYYEYIKCAKNNGIVNGIGETEFMPDALITREDLCVMLQRAIKSVKVSPVRTKEFKSFADAEEISDYAADAVKDLYEYGVINGTGEDKFEPALSATRAMSAKVIGMIYNIYREG